MWASTAAGPARRQAIPFCPDNADTTGQATSNEQNLLSGGCPVWLLLHRHVRTHPGMNAALIMMRPSRLHFGLGAIAWRDEVTSSELKALGCGLRVARKLVQQRHNSAAKLVYLRKRVSLAAVVSGLERLTVMQPDLPRSEMPGTEPLCTP